MSILTPFTKAAGAAFLGLTMMATSAQADLVLSIESNNDHNSNGGITILSGGAADVFKQVPEDGAPLKASLTVNEGVLDSDSNPLIGRFEGAFNSISFESSTFSGMSDFTANGNSSLLQVSRDTNLTTFSIIGNGIDHVDDLEEGFGFSSYEVLMQVPNSALDDALVDINYLNQLTNFFVRDSAIPSKNPVTNSDSSFFRAINGQGTPIGSVIAPNMTDIRTEMTPVPEPSSAILFGLATLGLAFHRRRDAAPA